MLRIWPSPISNMPTSAESTKAKQTALGSCGRNMYQSRICNFCTLAKVQFMESKCTVTISTAGVKECQRLPQRASLFRHAFVPKASYAQCSDGTEEKTSYQVERKRNSEFVGCGMSFHRPLIKCGHHHGSDASIYSQLGYHQSLCHISSTEVSF